MSPRSIGSAFVIAVVAALAATGVTEGAKKPAAERCKPPNAHYKVVVANRSARIYQRGAKGSIVGCAAGRSRITRLADNYGDCFPDGCAVLGLQVAGPFAGLIEGFGGRSGSFTDVRVVDLRTGRKVFTHDAVDDHPPGEDGFAYDMVVTTTRAVAWVAERPQFSPDVPPLEVHVVDAGGDRVVESSPLIDPRSLALAGDRLYWRSGDETRTLALRGVIDAQPGWTRATR